MDPATPGAVLLASSDDEVATGLEQTLTAGGWRIHRARSAADAHRDVELALVVRLDDRPGFLTAWRQCPRSRAIPVLLLADEADPGADAHLPPHPHADVLRSQMLLLARLRHAERDSRSQRARLQEILDHAPLAVSVKDENGRYLLVNRSWEAAFQRRREQVLGRTMYEVFPAEQADRLALRSHEAIRDGRLDYEEVVHQADGPQTYLKSKFALREGGEHGGSGVPPGQWTVCGIATDITQRKNAEQALRDSEALYSSLVENLPVCIFRKDLHGRFTFVNTPFCVELKRSPVEIVGRSDHDFYPAELAEKYTRDDRQVISAVRVFECVEEHATPEGDLRYVQVIKSPLHDADGRVIGMQGIFWDVTDRKRAQENLARTAADIDIARRVQRKLFPAPLAPAVRRANAAGFDLAGASYPVEAIGGDYYDFFDLADGGLGVAVGDVAGHGIGPALLMATTRSYLHASARSLADPAAILAQVNELIVNDIEGDRYITLLLARLDLARRTLRYASAGHATAYVLDHRNKIKHALESTGQPLGVHPASRFEVSGELPLASGDQVVLLTDGIVEARDPARNTFGPERVLELMRVYRRASAAQQAENLYHAVRAFSQNQPQLDDITAVVIKVAEDIVRATEDSRRRAASF